MKIYVLLFAFFFTALSANAQKCNVEKINDGDTIVANCSGVSQRIRFCGIDAPETKRGSRPAQPYGNESKQLLQRLLAGGDVEIKGVEYDRYQRLVAELFVSNTYLNAELVRAGLAYEYKKYSKKCPNRLQLINAEATAKSKRLGVWDGGIYILPWDYRRSNR